jgi:hypothetical protein
MCGDNNEQEEIIWKVQGKERYLGVARLWIWYVIKNYLPFSLVTKCIYTPRPVIVFVEEGILSLAKQGSSLVMLWQRLCNWRRS